MRRLVLLVLFSCLAGEGLMDPLKAGEKRLLSFALDLGLVIDAKSEPVPTRTTRVSVNKGLLIQQAEDHQRRIYSARNEDAEARTLIIEHPVRAGWIIGGSVKPVESTPQVHRFRVTVEPRTTATFTVDETRQVSTQIAVTNITDNQIGLYLRDKALTPELEGQLREVIRFKTAMAAIAAEIAQRQGEIDQIGRDQDRVRENMKSLGNNSEARQLMQRYVKQLDDQETRIETLRKELATHTAALAKAQADLARFIEGM